MTELLSASRIKYKSVVAGKNLPDLIKISKGVGKYGVIIFEDFRSYLDMDDWNRDLLIKYCRTFQERLENCCSRSFCPSLCFQICLPTGGHFKSGSTREGSGRGYKGSGPQIQVQQH